MSLDGGFDEFLRSRATSAFPLPKGRHFLFEFVQPPSNRKMMAMSSGFESSTNFEVIMQCLIGRHHCSWDKLFVQNRERQPQGFRLNLGDNLRHFIDIQQRENLAIRRYSDGTTT